VENDEGKKKWEPALQPETQKPEENYPEQDIWRNPKVIAQKKHGLLKTIIFDSAAHNAFPPSYRNGLAVFPGGGQGSMPANTGGTLTDKANKAAASNNNVFFTEKLLVEVELAGR
jgi:hypothetical protein